jgi:hypothetical protein
MQAEEREICNYLKGFPGQFISAREIARRAGGKWRFREDPHWSTPVLALLLEKKVIETDSSYSYRLIIKPERKPRHWISPQMKKILESNGNFTHIIEEEAEEKPKE